MARKASGAEQLEVAMERLKKAKTAAELRAAAPPVAPSLRVSLSLAMLAESEHIALVATGKTKRRLLDRLSKDPDSKLPIVWLLQHTQAPIRFFEMDMDK